MFSPGAPLYVGNFTLSRADGVVMEPLPPVVGVMVIVKCCNATINVFISAGVVVVVLPGLGVVLGLGVVFWSGAPDMLLMLLMCVVCWCVLFLFAATKCKSFVLS